MQTLHSIPLFQELAQAETVLLAGAGGGFDIYSGIPLYLSLTAQGKKVYLANLSFTWLSKTSAEQVYPPFLFKVNAQDKNLYGDKYFPEKYLAQWLDVVGYTDEVVYAFERQGVNQLKKSYDYLIDTLKPDAIVLVDGGTDSIMFGDEEKLGTPVEDCSSMAAVHQTGFTNTYLVCLGFGVDHFHGVSHFRFLENVAHLMKEGGFLGSFHLLPTMEEGKKLLEAIEFVNARMRKQPSIVANSIGSALEGEYGDVHRTHRTAGSELWINPLMTIYWCFQLDKVVREMKYYDYIKDTNSMKEIHLGIAKYRKSLEHFRKNLQLPI